MQVYHVLNSGDSKITENLPEGARRVHFGAVDSIFRPRGSMAKNSLGAYLLDTLKSNYEHWTNLVYSDNPPKELLKETLRFNLDSEVQAAWRVFVKELNTK